MIECSGCLKETDDHECKGCGDAVCDECVKRLGGEKFCPDCMDHPHCPNCGTVVR